VKNQKRIFAQFSKVEKQEDGTLKVYGVASSETRDSDGEVILADAMRKALPDYLTFGAVREMHQPIAAGTAIEASVDDAGVTQFAAHVVDPVSVKKVETGVLKGFSIGGKIVKRDKDDKTIITELKTLGSLPRRSPRQPRCGHHPGQVRRVWEGRPELAE
jgi:phage head maturation protease